MPSVFSHEINSPLYKGKLSVNTGLFINGKFVDAVEQGTLEVVNPANGEVITKIAAATAKDVNIAVEAARKAYKTSWGTKVPASERGRLLNKLADLIERDIDQLSALEALDAGKHFGQAKQLDLAGVIGCIRYYAGWADKNSGKTIETSEAKFCYTRHEPIGVVALVVPWNFPLLITSWKIGPALACGNVVLLKPSEVTPLSALKLAELVHEAGFPPGVFSVLPGLGPSAGQALAEHKDIGKISFTGSGVVGRKIMETAARTNLKRVTLELGGKSPSIVFDDANLEQAFKWVAGGIFLHSGQVCAAGSRIFVQETIYDKFVETFKGIAASFKRGDGFDPTTTQTAVVSKVQLDRVLNYIEIGKREGATLETGGVRSGSTGFFIEPTVFTDVTKDMQIVREEIFGPVAVIIKFKDEAEVIELANDTTFGLAAVVFSQNIGRALRVTHALEAGACYVNMSAIPDFQISFGGIKQSGFGKDMGEYALESFTTVKAVQVNLGIDL